jgi:hypothetical protein
LSHIGQDNPFRKIRQFVYIAVGLAGTIGTVTSIPALFFASQSADVDTSNNLINLAIDVAGVASAVAFWNKDAADEAKKVENNLKKKQQGRYQMDDGEVTDRALELANMPVQIQSNSRDADETKIVRFGDLQSKGRQHVIVVAGRFNFIKDQVISARLEGPDLFNSQETYVVPVVIDGDVEGTILPQLDEAEAALKKGFGKAETLMEAPYIGKPTQMSAWLGCLAKEIELAQKQGTADIVEQGLVLGVRRDGCIVRRGVGAVPWRQLVMDVSKTHDGEAAGEGDSGREGTQGK